MGFLDSLFGRGKPARADLDQIFALPAAAITLEVGMGIMPTGVGAVAFRAPEGKAFADVQSEVLQLLGLDAQGDIEVSVDDFGYTWITVRREPPDLDALTVDLHAINTSLADNGFGPQLLCSLVAFNTPKQHAMAMVYLYKQGTWYPFVPDPKAPGASRDNVMELSIRNAVRSELPIEPELGRWFAVWGAPGLD